MKSLFTTYIIFNKDLTLAVILSSILSIFKIIGVIFLAILTILVILIFILLISKIKFKLDFENYQNNIILFDFSYLFGILKINYNSNAINIKVFGINLKKKCQNKDTSENTNNSNQQQIHSSQSINSSENKQINKQTNINENFNGKTNHTSEKKLDNRDFSNKENNSKSSDFKIWKEVKDILNYKDKFKLFKVFNKFIKNFIYSFKIKKFNINFTYGFDCPCETGKICAIINIIIPFFHKYKVFDINLIPDFDNTVFKGNLNIHLETRLIKILFAFLKLLFSRPIIKLIRRRI